MPVMGMGLELRAELGAPTVEVGADQSAGERQIGEKSAERHDVS